MRLIVGLLLIIGRLKVHFEESIKQYLFTTASELFGGSADTYLYCCFLNLGICHLGSNGTLPNKLIETTLRRISINIGNTHIGGANGLVSLLCTFNFGVIISNFYIFLTIELINLCLCHIERHRGKIG